MVLETARTFDIDNQQPYDPLTTIHPSFLMIADMKSRGYPGITIPKKEIRGTHPPQYRIYKPQITDPDTLAAFQSLKNRARLDSPAMLNLLRVEEGVEPRLRAQDPWKITVNAYKKAKEAVKNGQTPPPEALGTVRVFVHAFIAGELPAFYKKLPNSLRPTDMREYPKKHRTVNQSVIDSISELDSHDPDLQRRYPPGTVGSPGDTIRFPAGTLYEAHPH